MPSDSAARFAALPRMCGRSGGRRTAAGGDRLAPPTPLPARAPSAAAARFAALPKMYEMGSRGRVGLDDLDHALLAAAAARLSAGRHWNRSDLARDVGMSDRTAGARVRRMRDLGLWPHAQVPAEPSEPPPPWLPTAPLDERRRRLAEGHFAMARAVARRLGRLGDDAESEAVWQVVSLAARWAGDESGFAAEVSRRLANVRRKAWAARRLIRPGVGTPAPRVESLTRPDGRVMELVDERTVIKESEWDGPMLFSVTVTAPGRPTLYVASTGGLVADAAFARKWSTAAGAECWREDWVARHGRVKRGRGGPGARRYSAVVAVCSGNAYDRGSVVLDRMKSIDLAAVATNGAAGRHALDHRPRNHCREWLADRESPGIPLPRSDFNALARAGRFVEGPFRDTFGDGVFDPYSPDRQAFGRLDDGRCVYCELAEDRP